MTNGQDEFKNREWKKKQKRYFVLSLADEILIAGIITAIMFLAGFNLIYCLATFLFVFLIITALKFKLYPFHPPYTGKEAMIGKICIAVTSLSPEGVVKYNGELWKAICINPPVKAGEELRIVDVDGLTLVVERA